MMNQTSLQSDLNLGLDSQTSQPIPFHMLPHDHRGPIDAGGGGAREAPPQLYYKYDASATNTNTTGGNSAERSLLPFNTSFHSTTVTTSPIPRRFPGEALTATLGYTFLPEYWAELQRQVDMYTYPDTRTSSAYSYLHGRNSRLDKWPGRCKRSDGKKWRCSREALAKSRYCDLHLHRASRSRKHVETTQIGPLEDEQNNNILSSSTITTVKRSRLDEQPYPSAPPVQIAPGPPNVLTRVDTPQQLFRSASSFKKPPLPPCKKPRLPPYKEPSRGYNLMGEGVDIAKLVGTEQELQQLIETNIVDMAKLAHSERELQQLIETDTVKCSRDSSVYNISANAYRPIFRDEQTPLGLFRHANFPDAPIDLSDIWSNDFANPATGQSNNESSLFLNPDPNELSRDFFDALLDDCANHNNELALDFNAWSNANSSINNTNHYSVSSLGNASSSSRLPPSSLNLSIAMRTGGDKKSGEAQMCLGIGDVELDCDFLCSDDAEGSSWLNPLTWVDPKPVGGPLAEALGPIGGLSFAYHCVSNGGSVGTPANTMLSVSDYTIETIAAPEEFPNFNHVF